MKQVSKEEFYNYIGPKDIVITNIKFGENGYSSSDFETRHRQLVGRSVKRNHTQKSKEYYLSIQI